MSSGNKLIKNTFIYSIGIISSKVLSFALIPLFSYYLTKEEFGIYDFILVNIGLLLPFINLQLPVGVYRWLSDKSDEEHLSARVISSGFFIILCLCAVFCLLYTIFVSLTDIDYKVYFAVALILHCFLNLFHGVARGIGRNDIYVKSSIIMSFCLIVFTCVFVVGLDMNVEGLLLAYIIANMLPTLYIVLATSSLHQIKLKYYDKELLKDMLKFSLPLVSNNVSWWLINSASRYIILSFFTYVATKDYANDQLGIFGFAARFPTIIVLFNTIFGAAWQDQVVQDKSSNEFSNTIFKKYFNFQIGILFPLIACSKLIIVLFISEEFEESWKYMGLLFVAASLAGFAYYYSAFYQEKKMTKRIFHTTAIGGIVNILVSFAFINYLGLYAVALGMAVGYLVNVALMAYFFRTYFVPDISKLKIGLLTVLLAFYIISTLYINHLGLEITLIIIAFVIFYVLNKETIKTLLQIGLSKLRKS